MLASILQVNPQGLRCLALALLSGTTEHLSGNIRSHTDRRQFVANIRLCLSAALISRLAVIAQRHVRVLLQTCRSVFQKYGHKVVPGRHAGIDQLLAHLQVLCAGKAELTAH